MGKGSPWLRVPSPSEFAATHNYSGFAAPTPEPFCAGCWPNCRPASKTNSRLTSTGRAGNTDQPANGQARVESKSSAASSRHFRLPRAWASRASFASGSTCCGLVIENLRARPHNPRKPVFDARAHFCHSAPMETHALGFRLRANAPKGQKRFPISALKRRDLKQATQVTLRSGGCGKRQEEFLRRSVLQISTSLTDSRAPV